MIHENKSGLEPLGRAVLLKPYEPEKKKGLIELPDVVKDRTLLVEQRAVIVAIGPHCWPDEPPRAAVGDKVMVSQMTGVMTKGTLDGERYRVVNDRDIYMRIVGEHDAE